jgi:hypothetical protein
MHVISASLHAMEVDDIISYHDVVTAEKSALQKRMNYGGGKKYFLIVG